VTEMIHLPWRDMVPPGSMNPINTSLLMEEIEALVFYGASMTVLEVGAARGFSTVALGRVAAQLVTIEPGGWVCPLSELEANLDREGLLGAVEILPGFSTEIMPLLAAQGFKYDLIFLDGDHAAETLEKDIYYALQLLAPGGILACHDYLEDCCVDVKPTCDRLLPPPDHIIGTMAVYL
jgi:predicted O-methyltransferase YrrM